MQRIPTRLVLRPVNACSYTDRCSIQAREAFERMGGTCCVFVLVCIARIPAQISNIMPTQGRLILLYFVCAAALIWSGVSWQAIRAPHLPITCLWAFACQPAQVSYFACQPAQVGSLAFVNVSVLVRASFLKLGIWIFVFMLIVYYPCFDLIHVHFLYVVMQFSFANAPFM